MGLFSFSSAAALGISLVIGYVFYTVNQVPEVPDIHLEYWGPGTKKVDIKAITPFNINISDLELKELQNKLASARPLVPPLEGVAFNYGINTDYLKSFVEFWKTKYNWREREAYLNSLPQFMTEIGGLKIHFIHAKPEPSKTKGKRVLPLLLMHGWPGSVREFYDIIPMFTSPRQDLDFVFEVIAPSLPGYGFSQAASKPGLGPAEIGVIFNELMSRLGFEKYYIQGGDWGSSIGRAMAVFFPQRVIGYHSNLCIPNIMETKFRALLAYLFPSIYVKEELRETFKNQLVDILLESGYFHIQATKPDTVGVALTDSPVGLAAYILEKFSTWTNKANRNLPDGGLEKAYDKTKLLDNIMIYWFTKSITTSARLYSETFNRKYLSLNIDRIPVMIPTACPLFPHELVHYPPIMLEGAFLNLVSTNYMPKGGHFAALETPKLLADDVWSFVKTLRSQKKMKR